ncbi:hypothetical protein M9Y10_020774 [Tritrichomonas musculus]|uniref:Uncharacterized protein n=1 Tax=Tritrichomonas musculus TaxID=1915356 RepID=A0ABR2HGJ4_9EUKA
MIQSPHNAHCTHLQKIHASPSTKTKNNTKSSLSQPVQKINNNQQATSSTPSTPKTHAYLSAKTENKQFFREFDTISSINQQCIVKFHRYINSMIDIQTSTMKMLISILLEN